jgi:threonine synthase
MDIMNPLLIEMVCLECGHIQPPDVMAAGCPACGSAWLDARYDYEAVAALWHNSAALRLRVASLWRYAELLPLEAPDPEITLDEGGTPLLRLYPYERMYDAPPIYVKDERQGPTSSFKDRQAAVAVTAMRRAGIDECVLASTGNAAAAYAAYCARARIRLWLFLPQFVSGEKLREAALYGAHVVRINGSYDEAKHVAAHFAARRGIHLDRGAKAIPGKESMKTLAFEIAESLGLRANPAGGGWVAPDWYIQAVSGGIGPLGVLKGFTELYQMGLTDRVPKLGIIQAAGCAPMVRAFETDARTAPPVTPKTLITVLATGDPGFSYVQLRAAIQQFGGAMLAIEDGQTFAAMRRVAETAGFSVEPATAVAFAGLEKLLTDGVIASGETVVVNASGHTFPAESHILRDQYMVEVELQQHDADVRAALDAAVSVLDQQLEAALLVTDRDVRRAIDPRAPRTILHIDDNPADRRLIRRMIKNTSAAVYTIYEAGTGRDGLKAIYEHHPDLIILDLVLPDVDGVAILTTLHADPELRGIPVFIYSGRSLTDDERAGVNVPIYAMIEKATVDRLTFVSMIDQALS